MQAMLVPLRKLITYLTFGKLACAILQTKTFLHFAQIRLHEKRKKQTRCNNNKRVQ